MNVGIRELKAHLSEYVGRAAGGENIIVTDRGKPIAQIVGLSGTSMLDRGIEDGWITPPSRNRLAPTKRFNARQSTSEVLDEDRG
ncbi:MAG: type II toxin-antitoxin system prevent-host-death family antitoxin [Acidimicrobiaceae bacterium]|nr:type II toxin-antitoxin system prevent-host-death family antitoxin [Acidimicrobiaceae bacterium]MXW61510.1 type II toxin-antitoxin system prevent-host-death family antitoxin [Acidimicrobiaceae bacterium]MXW76113.1 type II toxin-antitoxin system prevent-host-death family antitoxin [Acidimicrobiaceae bacterium]MYA74821.1 type II toxin-antitoxin system prevent-host-death family antitoxin [Acidimicrobiaceae bacterium]MYC40982.1 type II toxin-antitoxin system prevent-host-death family antitoxin [